MPFWQFFRNWLIGCIGWIGQALLMQPSKTANRIFFLFYILIYLLQYETNVRSISALPFGHSDPDPSSETTNKWLQKLYEEKRYIFVYLKVRQTFVIEKIWFAKLIWKVISKGWPINWFLCLPQGQANYMRKNSISLSTQGRRKVWKSGCAGSN